MNVRRRILVLLQAFLLRCRRRTQRDVPSCATDPFGDLFMGFEGKRKPVLESIMDHHGLLLGDRNGLSSEKMRNTIVSHIAAGHCARSILYNHSSYVLYCLAV